MRLGAAVNVISPAPALLEHIQIAVGWEKEEGRWNKINSFYLEVYEPAFLGLFSYLPDCQSATAPGPSLPWTKCKSQI